MPRGPSAALVKAEKYASKHPQSNAVELAKKFGLDQATIYRSAWYKAHRAAQKAAQKAAQQ